MSSVWLAATITHYKTILPDIFPPALVLLLLLLRALSRVLDEPGKKSAEARCMPTESTFPTPSTTPTRNPWITTVSSVLHLFTHQPTSSDHIIERVLHASRGLDPSAHDCHILSPRHDESVQTPILASSDISARKHQHL